MASSAFDSSSFPSLLGPPPPFPGLRGSSSGPSASSPPPPSLNWKEMFDKQQGKGSATFSLSFIPDEAPEVIFSADDLEDGVKDWELALVGHALGKRPFYGALLAAVRKQWKLVGNLDLLTLEGDFFLFKFSCREDYEMVWNGGPCFLNGKPFLFKKWSWDFRPVKEDFAEIPLWIKFPNFPLCCWNEKGLSKVASRIGTPLAADHLTTTKNRLTFARVCVQVAPSSVLPDSIPILLNGQKVDQVVLYDWKPRACIICNTFAHDYFSCPNAPPVQELNCGRSRGRNRHMQRDRSFTRPHSNPSIVVPPNMETPIQAQPLITIQDNASTIPTSPVQENMHAQVSLPVPNPSTLLHLTPSSVQLASSSTILNSSGRQPSASRERRPPPPPIITDLNSPPPSNSSPPPDCVGPEFALNQDAASYPANETVEDSQPSSPQGRAPKPNPKTSNPIKGRRRK